MEKKYDYVIVGAGIYGATMAYLIRNTYPSKEVLIIDKNDYVGGMCYDEWQDGILVQKHGAHIFHTSNQEVWDFVNKFGKWDQFCNCVKAKASDGKLYSLPFNMNTFYEIFKTETPEEAQKIIEKEIKKYGVKEPKNLEEQAISMVGKTIYEKLIKGYTEKQWKCKATELDPSIIKRLPLRYFYDNDYYNCLYEALPEEGFTKFIEKIIEKSYSDIKLSTPFSSEHVKLLKENGKIIYTGSVDELFNYEYGPLDYRTTYWEYEKLPIKSFQGTQVVNYTSNKEPYTRIAEFKYFDKLHRADEFPYTIISKEFPDEYSIGKPPYYPINNEKNQKLFNKYKWLADQCGNVILGGRLGEYKYYDMDKVLEKAFEDFKSIQSQMECSS